MYSTSHRKDAKILGYDYQIWITHQFFWIKSRRIGLGSSQLYHFLSISQSIYLYHLIWQEKSVILALSSQNFRQQHPTFVKATTWRNFKTEETLFLAIDKYCISLAFQMTYNPLTIFRALWFEVRFLISLH